MWFCFETLNWIEQKYWIKVSPLDGLKQLWFGKCNKTNNNNIGQFYFRYNLDDDVLLNVVVVVKVLIVVVVVKKLRFEGAINRCFFVVDCIAWTNKSGNTSFCEKNNILCCCCCCWPNFWHKSGLAKEIKINTFQNTVSYFWTKWTVL